MDNEKPPITQEMARTEVLREFAALTRHQPPALDRRFTCTLEDAPDADEKVLSVTFYKREAACVFTPEVMGWSLDRFAAEIAKPLAKQLLESAF